MSLKKPSYIVNIIERTLNHTDRRLIDHGKRVAYLVYRVLKKDNRLTDKQIRDCCLIGLLHDIGAYKTEEISNMTSFETGKVWEHSIYGYLFVKHFSPLAHLSPILLFHHSTLEELNYLHPDYRDFAQIIFLADRLDILSLGDRNDWDHLVSIFDNAVFDPKIVDLFFKGEGSITAKDFDRQYDEDFINLLYNSDFTPDEVTAYLHMAILSIEFRSPQTVSHTFTTVKLCELLAPKLGLNVEKIKLGALLHDIGKVGVSLDILESNKALSAEEFSLMKDHVLTTKAILDGLVSDDVLNLAINHHEKLNGGGYARNLQAKDLTLGERLVAIADIFSALVGSRTYKDSFSKEKIMSIFKSEVENGNLDLDIVNLVLDNYEYLIEETKKTVQTMQETYKKIDDEYNKLIFLQENFKSGEPSLYIDYPLIW